MGRAFAGGEPFRWRGGSAGLKAELASMVKRAAPTEDVIFGMLGDAPGPETIYLDHAYFARGWHYGNFRAVRGGIHLTRIIPPREPRLRHFGVQMAPYRKDGRKVLVLVPSFRVEAMIGRKDMAQEMAAEARKRTDRPVVLKEGKTGLAEALRDTWVVICPVSVGGVEALVAGVPVISTPYCPSWPLSNKMNDIESPELFDRQEWAESLAGATWNTSEIGGVDWRNYQR